jgi:membrane protease subunit HflC
VVSAGEAIVITQFGDPVRVLTVPGLAWKLPAPIQGTIPVDLRLRGTSTGLQDVGTKDGLRILVQAYVAWQVPSNPDHIRRFVRAVRNDPDEAARQLRSLVGSALQVTASSFDLADLVNTDPGRVRLAAFEAKLRDQIQQQVLETYGIQVVEAGRPGTVAPNTDGSADLGVM